MRLLVPDVARGLALLGIALANAPTAWFIDETPERADFFGGATTPLDDATVLFTAVTTHVRGLPMFSTLLGFGVGLIVMSLWRKGVPVKKARAIVTRRYAFLALFGAIHCVFLFYGDIMFLYGVAGVILGLLFTFKDKTLLRIAYVILGLQVLFGLVVGVLALVFASGSSAGDSLQTFNDLSTFGEAIPESYFDLVLTNFGAFFFEVLLLGFLLPTPFSVMIIGFVWARRGVISHPEQHRTELRVWAALSVVVSLLIGIPWGLSTLGMLPESWETGLSLMNQCLGFLTGPGILALLTLLVNSQQKKIWSGAKTPLYLAIPAALGKRSMTGYLFQSFAFAVLAYPFFLGLDLDAFAMSIAALGIWAASLALAWVMELRGWAGPFEKLHRRLAYGPSGTVEVEKSSKEKSLEGPSL